MSGFNCKYCGFDLSLRIDLLALAVNQDNEEFPKDLVFDGSCNKCNNYFHFSGEMFSKFLTMKIKENIIDPDTENYAIIEFDISNGDAEHFRKLIKECHKEEAKKFIFDLMKDDDIGKDD